MERGGRIDQYLNKIICGDCLEVMKDMPGKCVDLVITSPPYFNSAKKYQRGSGIHYSMDIGEPLYVIEDCSLMLLGILKDDGFYCLNLGFSYGETGVLRPFYIVQRLLRQGWFCIDIIVWHKNNPIPIKKRLTNAIEFIFVLSKHPLSQYPNDVGYRHNVLNCSIAKGDGFSSAPFPVELPKFCMEVFSKENDIVLDPFNGSGTTCVAAKSLKRNYIGIDINPQYCQIAQQRIEGVDSESCVPFCS